MTTVSRRAALVASFATLAGKAMAQAYPARPIKLVVGYAPGGGPDAFARLLAPELGKAIGQSVVVENRLGAAGTLATSSVVNSPADGYTLLLAETAQLEIAPFIHRKLSYNTLKDLTPIALLIVSQGSALVTSSRNTSFRTMREFIKVAQAEQVTFGSSGIGSLFHINMEVLKAELGLNLLHVPYKGSGMSMPAMLSGEVDVAINSLQAVLEHVRSAKAHMLATTGTRRFLPDVPVFEEFMANKDPYLSELSLHGPAGLPADIQQKIANAAKSAMAAAPVAAGIQRTHMLPAFVTSDAFRRHIEANLRKYESAVKRAGIEQV